MGSQAQDARHERLLNEARDTVFHLERQIEPLKAQLLELEKSLLEARQNLAVHETIDMNRD